LVKVEYFFCFITKSKTFILLETAVLPPPNFSTLGFLLKIRLMMMTALKIQTTASVATRQKTVILLLLFFDSAWFTKMTLVLPT